MSISTEHQSVGPSHPDEWREGYTCDDCKEDVRKASERHVNPGKNVYWNVMRLAADREGHYTQRELGKDIFDRARAEGREIQKAR